MKKNNITSNYNKASIMRHAWKFFKHCMGSFSNCLKMAWKNAKVVRNELVKQVNECHTWYGWKELGYEVIHESVALFKVTVVDTTKNGTRVLSYFDETQVCPIGSQD